MVLLNESTIILKLTHYTSKTVLLCTNLCIFRGMIFISSGEKSWGVLGLVVAKNRNPFSSASDF